MRSLITGGAGFIGSHTVAAATGASVSWNRILAEMEAVLDTKPSRRDERSRPGDVPYAEGDSTRMRALRWAPRMTVHDGLLVLLSPLVKAPSTPAREYAVAQGPVRA